MVAFCLFGVGFFFNCLNWLFGFLFGFVCLWGLFVWGLGCLFIFKELVLHGSEAESEKRPGNVSAWP